MTLKNPRIVCTCQRWRICKCFPSLCMFPHFLKSKTYSTSSATEYHTVVGEKLQSSLTKVSVIPTDVEDFDKENWDDPYQVSNYAMDIFNYLKEREGHFVMTDYMQKQVHLSKWMRALLVDWMVEVQESIELNHETLYLAVKLVDYYLCNKVVQKDYLQLLGAASLLIAWKFDVCTYVFWYNFVLICPFFSFTTTGTYTTLSWGLPLHMWWSLQTKRTAQHGNATP